MRFLRQSSLAFLAFCWICNLLVVHSTPAQEASQALNYKCLDRQSASSIKDLLEIQKFYIDFCSTCPKTKASIRRINISEVSLTESECGYSVNVKGLVVRGIKPPVFDGLCSTNLEVYSPSLALDVPFEGVVNPGNIYLWNSKSSSFGVLSLGASKACIQNIVLKK